MSLVRVAAVRSKDPKLVVSLTTVLPLRVLRCDSSAVTGWQSHGVTEPFSSLRPWGWGPVQGSLQVREMIWS